MVGIPSFGNAETIGYVVRATTAGMVQYFPEMKPILVNSDGGSPDDTPRVAVSTESPDYLEKVILVSPKHKLQRISVTYQGTSGKGTAVRALFEVARELKVKAMVMVDSDLRSIVPEWVELLAGPILKGGYDFVAPMYARYKYDGTITNNISYPLTRALYGARIRQPIGGDFAVSGDLVARYLELDTFDDLAARFGIDIWMTHSAINEGFAVCQARLGAKIHDAKDPAQRPRPDVPPGRRHALQAGRTLRGPLAARQGLAPDPGVRLRARRGSGGDQRQPRQARRQPRAGAARPARGVEPRCSRPSSSSESWPSRPTASRPTSTSAPSYGSAASTTASSRTTGRAPIVSGCWPALTPLYFGRTAGFISDTLRADHRSGGAGHRRPGSSIRGAQAVPRRPLGRCARPDAVEA